MRYHLKDKKNKENKHYNPLNIIKFRCGLWKHPIL